ncbi:hypothetical protein ACFB49_06450 [Sphingomonas sp. DBB INV C78]|uniref:hypothetical protein n=1 Tax=Sphingomonas sp. DBB INV C78 TaxID=3349434 RepID=UPI0036D30DB3
MIAFPVAVLLTTGSTEPVSMTEICQADVIEKFATSTGRLKVQPAARRADGSWAITGTVDRPGKAAAAFQCEIDAKGRFLGAAETGAAER